VTRIAQDALALAPQPEAAGCDPVGLLLALVVILRIQEETAAFLRASCLQTAVAEIRC
jgi:hypothetical protein